MATHLERKHFVFLVSEAPFALVLPLPEKEKVFTRRKKLSKKNKTQTKQQQQEQTTKTANKEKLTLIPTAHQKNKKNQAKNNSFENSL